MINSLRKHWSYEKKKKTFCSSKETSEYTDVKQHNYLGFLIPTRNCHVMWTGYQHPYSVQMSSWHLHHLIACRYNSLFYLLHNKFNPSAWPMCLDWLFFMKGPESLWPRMWETSCLMHQNLFPGNANIILLHSLLVI